MRSLPTMDICGDLFYVDLRMGGLLNDQSPYNVIEFAAMEYIKALQKPEQDKKPLAAYSALRFLFDKSSKDLYESSEKDQTLRPEVEYMEGLHPDFLDPVAKLRTDGIEDRSIAALYDFKKPIQHKARVIPKVSVLGHNFFVDTLRGLLQHVTDKTNKIYFSQIQEGESQLYFDFNYRTGRVVATSEEKIFQYPEIEVAILPKLNLLDPIGWQRLNGASAGFLLNEPRLKNNPGRRYRVIPYDENYGMPRKGRHP